MTEQIGTAAIPQQAPPPGTIVFRTRGIAPDPVRPVKQTVSVGRLPSARAAAFTSAVVLALNAVPRLQPPVTERLGLTGAEGEAAAAVAQAASRVASPVAAPDPPALLLAPAWAADAMLLVAVAAAACLLFRAPLPRRAWTALLVALALLALLPAWPLLTGGGLDNATAGVAVLLALAGALLVRRAAKAAPGAAVPRSLRPAAVAGVLMSVAVPAGLALHEAQPAWMQDGTVSAGRAPASLEEQRAADAGVAATLRDQWVAQLASAKGGDQAYLDEHRSLAAAHGAVLVRGDDIWSDQLDATYWLTLGTTPFPTGQAALAWCDQQGLDRSHCIARVVATGPVPQSVMK